MPKQKQKLPKPPAPWAKKRVQSQIQRPVPTPPPKPQKSSAENAEALMQMISKKLENNKPLSKPLASTKPEALVAPSILDEDILETDVQDIPILEPEALPSNVPSPPPVITIPPPPTHPKPVFVRSRRPDYKHHLVGLNVGDWITFHKYPNIKAQIMDTDNKVSLDGIEYDGIVPAAVVAYKNANLNPPSKITGLREWRNDKGVRLMTLYEKVVPVTTTSLQIKGSP